MLTRAVLPLIFFTASLISCAPVKETSSRQAKNLAYFDYLPADLIDYAGYSNSEAGDYDENELIQEDNELSRTVPRRKQRPVAPAQFNSPIYYIRLPPQPYMFVPGVGYISQPPASPMQQFLNLPMSFVANGKPSAIYQWSGGLEIPTVAPPPPPPPPTRPKPIKKPDSTVHRLPGTYTFNGKPEDIFVLRDSYNSLYGDVLTNLYP